MSVDSQMVPLGTEAPPFELPNENPNVDVETVSFDEVSEGRDGTLVMFICQHCPYVQNIRGVLSDVATGIADRNVGVVAINSNDPEQYPDDSPSEMSKECERFGYDFPYLFDETQEVAKAYRAMCTPDLYLFDGDGELFYRGQFDSSRPGNGIEPTGEDLTGAVDALLDGADPPQDQHPSQGCSIKWKEGNRPDYFG